MNLDILYEDTHIIVCRKPADIPTQSKRVGTPDMVSLLKNHLYKNSGEKKEPYLAVIHRLDQPVEGILVFAKTPFAAKELNRQLQNHGFGKHYHALVAGHPTAASAVLEDYLVKDARTNTSRVCTGETPGAKLAHLSYDTVRAEQENTLLDITLETGRHHQIRVQLSHMGHPIIGDSKYGAVSGDIPGSRAVPSGPRLKLCAHMLEFQHPKTKKAMTFRLPV